MAIFKFKSSQELFDLADFMVGANVRTGIYIGTALSLDKPENITWVYIPSDAIIEKDDSHIYIRGLIDCDEFGNALKKQYTIKNAAGKLIYTSYMYIKPDEKFLFVKMGIDYKVDKNGCIKTVGRGKEKRSVVIETGPSGETGGFERRQNKLKIEQEKQETEERWAKRGHLYSPWIDMWAVSKTHPDFYNEIKTFRNDAFTGQSVSKFKTFENILDEAKSLNIDIDEVKQYFSEANSALREARTYNAMYGS